MLRIFASVLLAISGGQVPSQGTRDAPVWSVDKDTVYVGGCIQIVIDGPPQRTARCTLRLGDREPVRLVDSGPDRRWQHQTAVLLSHDMRYAERVESAREDEDVVWIPPIFREPGTVGLSLELDGEPIGTVNIKVIDAPDEAKASVRLMFPSIDHKAPLIEREAGSLWARLAAVDNFGIMPRATSEQVQQLRDELPIIMKHPDWAEIAEMLVARVETRMHYRGLVVSEEGRPIAIKDTVGELPPLPEIVTRCLNADPQSPFARAVQDDIRSVVKDLRLLDAQRRGEDMIEIIKSVNP